MYDDITNHSVFRR